MSEGFKYKCKKCGMLFQMESIEHGDLTIGGLPKTERCDGEVIPIKED